MKSILRYGFLTVLMAVAFLSPGVRAQEEDSELMKESTSVQDVYVKDEQTFWAVANTESGKGKVFHKDENTDSWVEQETAAKALRAIDCTPDNFCVAVGDDGIILKTVDGSSWTGWNSGIKTDLFDVAIVDGEDGVVVAVGEKGTFFPFDIEEDEDEGKTTDEESDDDDDDDTDAPPQTEEPMADLAISDLAFGTDGKFSYTMKNIGTVDAPSFTVNRQWLRADGTVITTNGSSISGLTAGQSFIARNQNLPPPEGALTLRVTLDPTDTVPEGDANISPSNNVAEVVRP